MHSVGARSVPNRQPIDVAAIEHLRMCFIKSSAPWNVAKAVRLEISDRSLDSKVHAKCDGRNIAQAATLDVKVSGTIQSEGLTMAFHEELRK